VVRLIANPSVLCCFLPSSLTGAPSLRRSYPASLVIRASPPPHTAQPVSHELPVDLELRSPFRVSRVASCLLCLHPAAIAPAGPMELFRSSISIVSGLPCDKARSALAIVVSGPAQRSLRLRPARSPSRHATLSIEGSDSFVASAAASIATGWSKPVPGRELHPLKSSAFSRRTLSPSTILRSASHKTDFTTKLIRRLLPDELKTHRDAHNFIGFPSSRQIHRLQEIVRSHRKRLSDRKPDSHLEAVLSEAATSGKAVGARDDEELVVHDQYRTSGHSH